MRHNNPKSNSYLIVTSGWRLSLLLFLSTPETSASSAFTDSHILVWLVVLGSSIDQRILLIPTSPSICEVTLLLRLLSAAARLQSSTGRYSPAHGPPLISPTQLVLRSRSLTFWTLPDCRAAIGWGYVRAPGSQCLMYP